MRRRLHDVPLAADGQVQVVVSPIGGSAGLCPQIASSPSTSASCDGPEALADAGQLGRSAAHRSGGAGRARNVRRGGSQIEAQGPQRGGGRHRVEDDLERTGLSPTSRL